jgi:erythronate-4-phosphate dehydrogenase
VHIVADANIPFATEYFGPLGEVRRVAGRGLTPETVRDADMLLVRSVTRVGRELLEGSPVRFVGSATAGVEHVDQPWLAAHGIAFAHAPGSNAESVAQYVAWALVWAARRTLARPLSRGSIGIVGVGQCGSRVERIARALGMEVALCDPPLARATGDPKYRPLAELLDCDYLTLHVPLTTDGPDATANLIDAGALSRMKSGAMLINTSRGDVVDEAALIAALDAGHLDGAILDVWRNEPNIHRALLRHVAIGTPHIAGYSDDAKLAGTRMICEAACGWLGRPAPQPGIRLPHPSLPEIEFDRSFDSFDEVADCCILSVSLPFDRYHEALMDTAQGNPSALGEVFDALRRNRFPRREFHASTRRLPNVAEHLRKRLRIIGLTIVP